MNNHATAAVGRCPVCGSTEFASAFEKRGVDYWKCVACSFLFSRPAVNPNFDVTLADFDPAYLQYFERGDADVRNFERVTKWIEEYTPLASAELLDVGCGSGAFVRLLRSRSVEAYGTEPSGSLYDRYLSAEPFFYHASIEDGALDRTFTIVTLLDVIEHVAQPDRLAAAVGRMLRPGGFVFLSTPNLASAFARIAGRRWHFINRYHLSYFTPETIVKLFERAHCELVDIRTIGKRFTLDYLVRYSGDFVLHRELPTPRWLADWQIWLDLHDTMYVCLAKR